MPQPRKLTEDAARALHTRYLAGESPRGLATEGGVALTTLLRTFRRFGLAIHSWGDIPHYQERNATIRRAMDNGVSAYMLAVKYGLTRQRIWAIYHADGKVRAETKLAIDNRKNSI